ncbi:MAG: FAD-binding oxidoreductase [bacterium]
MHSPTVETGTSGVREADPATALAAVLGPEFVVRSPEGLASYFVERPASLEGIVAVMPSTTEQVQRVLAYAHGTGLPVHTMNDGCVRAPEVGRRGVILDFSRMRAIEKLDRRNLLAHVQRGLTFPDLKSALEGQGLKMAAPLAATSESVLCNYVNRAPLKKATLYTEVHVFTMQVVLADGRLLKTGSHALNEDGADLREDGGPSLSRWHFGSDDIFGVVTRATIWLYPKTECRDALVFAFESREDALKALRNVPRTEQGWEYLALNRRFLEQLLGGRSRGLPAWALVVGFDGRERLVACQKRKVEEVLRGFRARPVEALEERFRVLLDEVWYRASPAHTGFYAPASRTLELDRCVADRAAAAGVPEEEIGRCLLAVDRARCLYSQYDFFGDAAGNAGARAFLPGLEKELCGQGAFFDRPQGELADFVLDRVPNLRTQIRTIKAVVDPRGILNPGRYVSHADPVYAPLPVAVEVEPGAAIDEERVRTVEELLKEAVGAEWVSSNRADLAAYGRDFTIYSGERPNLVALPQTTAEVQQIMRIAYGHRMPVVPLTTGFNHGGLTIPRKGGILVDLKRMNRLREIDEETMTATFEPGVRMRSLYFECNKVATFSGLKLKPILPLTLASISLLSNYVSRGGPGSAVKYGGGPDLTVNMTWVLPNGEILRTGPSSVPGVGCLGVPWGPGPDMSGMFFNADGAFGICTEITARLFPEMPCEHMMHTAIFQEDPAACEAVCSTIYDLAQQNLVEFMYKSHPGVGCVTIAGAMGGNPLDFVAMASKHPLAIIVTGLDEEETRVRAELVREILERNGILEVDPNMFGPMFADLVTTDPTKMSVGIKGNFVGGYKGAFQWQAGYIRVEKVPEISEAYKKLIRKYWKTSDVKVTMETALTGTDIQGPLPYARVGTVEFDYWWDQGNPESVKRASTMIRKTTELMFRYGVLPIRNMFGFGEILLPQLEVYQDILKGVRGAFDPANLMHPDVLPVTGDYV